MMPRRFQHRSCPHDSEPRDTKIIHRSPSLGRVDHARHHCIQTDEGATWLGAIRLSLADAAGSSVRSGQYRGGLRAGDGGEYLNHLSIARGSVNEVAALCAVIVALGFATPAAVQPVLIRIDALQRMLSGLRSRLKETRRESESAPHSLPAARCLTARQSLPSTRHPESQG